MPERYAALRDLASALRQSIVVMNCYAGSGHPGGSLSCVDILAWLFECELRFSVENITAPDRDRFILSKGHSCLALYAILAEKGFFSKNEFRQLRHLGGSLQGHPDHLKTPGVEFNSGSLGQGASFAVGCALAAKLRGWDSRYYALLGDGELGEGQVWEALMFAAHYRLDNLVFIIDYNKLQSDGYCSTVTSLEPLADKLNAFGCFTLEINGHDFADIELAFQRARAYKGKPTAIIAHTIKGKGISFMEYAPKWHGSLAPQGEERARALKECGFSGEIL